MKFLEPTVIVTSAFSGFSFDDLRALRPGGRELVVVVAARREQNAQASAAIAVSSRLVTASHIGSLLVS